MMTKNIDRVVLAVLTAAKTEQGLSAKDAAAWAQKNLEAGVARAQGALGELAVDTGASVVVTDLKQWAKSLT